MRDYRKLRVWKSAAEFVPLAYAVARQLPADERFGLASQLKRAAVSIASNIAEGSGRASDPDFERFLSIAAGSASEADCQFDLIARMWPSIRQVSEAQQAVGRIRRMLWSLIEASRQGRSTDGLGSEV